MLEELPTVHSRQAPGFAWVAVAEDPAKNWGTSNRKRQRPTGTGQTEQQKEALTARQQRETERKIKELNSDNQRDVQVAIPKRDGQGAAARAGRTTNTKKILLSGKTFAHYLDDEEAEIARTGKRDGDVESATTLAQRASKTPIARRKAREESISSSSPGPSHGTMAPPAMSAHSLGASRNPAPVRANSDRELAPEEEDESTAPLPTDAEMEALISAPPLTYNQARAAPPDPGAPSPRRFCETCGYWGRARCMKCGVTTCSIACKDDHDMYKCLKMYA